MTIEKTSDKYYYLAGDEKSKIGNCNPVDKSIHWDLFKEKEESYQLKEPIAFKIEASGFSGSVGDYQFNSCGFLLFSDKLRTIFEKYLTSVDKPVWYSAKIIDLNNQTFNYSILHFFARHDLLDHKNSTFVNGTHHPIKKRYDLDKIGDRLIFSTIQSAGLCVHDIVRKEIRKAGCTGTYLYKINSAGRLL